MTAFAPVTDRGVTPLRFSVIIANYNYDRYVGDAIRSALALDWPAVEVIVVDDGSSDGSADVIAGFGSAITFVRQPNGGQRVANNTGFAVSSGDVIVFLDADDIIEPAFAREVAAIWRPGVSKVQVQMMRVDKDGLSLGSVIPNIRIEPTPDQIRYWARQMTEYPSPPGSGNAYAREFLKTIFPIDETHDASTDSTCIAMAPFMGDVLTIRSPLVLYRIHGSNDSNLLQNEGRFGREVTRALTRFTAAANACAMRGLEPPARVALSRGKHLLQLRVASLRLRPAEHPMAGDGRLHAFADALAAPFRPGFEPLSHRLAIAAWALLTVVAPRSWARALIRRRFNYGA